jgi:hypothetical protein
MNHCQGLWLSIILASPALLAHGQVPEFGQEQTRSLVVISSSEDQLDTPRDLAFQPDNPDLLWVVNRSNDGTVIYSKPGEADQSSELRIDRYAYHFMEEVSSIAFGDATFQNSMTFATCHESRNTYNDTRYPNDFMGPTLWPADLDIYGVVNQDNRLLGSHIDMNHQSPNCMGIAHQGENKYWVFDGHNGHIVYYDFNEDHGPGHDDHSDAVVRRYTEAAVSRVADVPSHMIIDKAAGLLYIADTGNSRVLTLDVNSGRQARMLRATNEPLAEFSEYRDANVEVFAEGNLKQPSGLSLKNGRLFVSDHETGDIIAFDIASKSELRRIKASEEGIMGITHGPQGKIWFVNGRLSQVVRIDP